MLREQRSRERDQRDTTEEQEVPGQETARSGVASCEKVMLDDPEPAQDGKAQQPRQKIRGLFKEEGRELTGFIARAEIGRFQIEHQKGHGDGEDPIAEGADPAWVEHRVLHGVSCPVLLGELPSVPGSGPLSCSADTT